MVAGNGHWLWHLKWKNKAKGVGVCVCMFGALAMHMEGKHLKQQKKCEKNKKTKLKGRAYCHYKEGRKKKSFKKVQTPRFWVLTLLTEKDNALIMHAQGDDKSRQALLPCDTFCFLVLSLRTKARILCCDSL
jgi:Cu/Zn superoxide dismutase